MFPVWIFCELDTNPSVQVFVWNEMADLYSRYMFNVGLELMMLRSMPELRSRVGHLSD